MKEVLKDNVPAAKNLVPRIAVMGSGGGFRAMTAFSGAMSALVDSRIADMVMYNVGLSGSAWYLSTLYSHPDWPQKKSAIDLRSELRECIMSSAKLKLFDPLFWFRVGRDSITSPTYSFTDIYGRFIGEKLLKERMNSTLTSQQGKVSHGSAPLPLYAALNVKRKTSAKVFHEWIEFSPFAIGMPKYGTFLQPKLFGSEFFSGRVLKGNDEMKLHYLLGIWGSAYCALLHRFIKTDKIGPANVTEERQFYESEVENDFESHGRDDRDDLLTETTVRGGKPPITERIMKLPSVDKFTNDIHGRAAMVNNFMRYLRLQKYRPSRKIRLDGNLFAAIESTDGLFKELHEMNPTDAEKMYLVDAGLAFNSPFPLILRPEREVDLILSFDFSARESDKADPFTELRLAAEWAKLHEIPFPDINTPEIGSEDLKECYVFEKPDDHSCPIVMHFILINNKFRTFKSPGVKRETEEEKQFGKFDVFDDPDKPYSTTRFKYSAQAFDRLASLMEFNTLLYKDTIFNNIKKCVENRKNRAISEL
ncbi:cytosolic phospholipase A2-like [Ruditapes philippinarum]|uniref:cytosolic phospholipase A2-like n=1 Tax=Ruditapes philippinarum TaxID=129788 RepID=UPI00295B87AB|nr:cytosolic phospholipase A2-like [Ruditapes philippinarum]